MAENTPIKVVKEFFGMNLAQMKDEWIQKDLPADSPKRLTEMDKAQLIEGIANGSLTY